MPDTFSYRGGMEWLGCGTIFLLCAIFCEEPGNLLVPKKR